MTTIEDNSINGRDASARTLEHLSRVPQNNQNAFIARVNYLNVVEFGIARREWANVCTRAQHIPTW